MTSSFLPGPFWLVGCGNMAGAMLARWLAAGLDPARVTVIRPSGRPVAPGVRVLTELPEDETPALAMLGMKPYQLDTVASWLAPALAPETLLVSILAGVEIATLRDRFPTPRAIVRAMPNLPVSLGKGVVALHAADAGEDACAAVAELMAALGHIEWFDNEALFALAGHVTGAGPAFLFRFLDALAAAAEALGLPAEQASRLAAAMAEGAAALAAGSGDTPAELARRVASPGGTTQAGLEVLDAGAALTRLIRKTLEASRGRGLEMAAEARRSS